MNLTVWIKFTPREFRPALVLMLTLLMPSSWAARAEGYSFGIGPQQSATELAKRWVPIIRYLSEKSHVPLQFETAKDIPAFQAQMKAGAFDFAFINPYHYVIFHKVVGYNAFAREKAGTLVGILVVKKDNPIQSMAQLSGSTIAFPSANAIAATWLPMQMLKARHIEVIPRYVNTMDSVYLSVAKGLFPAGGGEMRTFGTIDPEVKNQLRVLWTSKALPPFTFAAHPRVPKGVVEKVQKAIAEMEQNPQGRELLKVINFKGIEAASDEDYNTMRAMNIKPMEAQ